MKGMYQLHFLQSSGVRDWRSQWIRFNYLNEYLDDWLQLDIRKSVKGVLKPHTEAFEQSVNYHLSLLWNMCQSAADCTMERLASGVWCMSHAELQECYGACISVDEAKFNKDWMDRWVSLTEQDMRRTEKRIEHRMFSDIVVGRNALRDQVLDYNIDTERGALGIKWREVQIAMREAAW